MSMLHGNKVSWLYTMVISPDTLRHHFDYDFWANQRLLEVAKGLPSEELMRDFGSSEKHLLGTLVHVYRSERAWLARLKEGAQKGPYKRPEDESLEELNANWPPLQQDWKQWLASLADPEKAVDYQDIQGISRRRKVWEILLHVVNHGTHHRGQASGFLRAMGKTPPPLDFIAYVRERDETQK